MKQPLIINIKGNSLDDGPGIRSVVFFKGCPLRCSWCHNPESQSSKPELSYDVEKCIRCGSCMEKCPDKAVSKNNPFFIDRDICTYCLECVDICPSGAIKQVGREIGAKEIVEEVIRYKPFFETSGGGVTLSGGEPTLFMVFTVALLKRFKEAGIHTLLETCGHFEMKQFEETLLPWVDTIYMDIKIVDPRKHKQHCGTSNDLILKNFVRLRQFADAGKVEFLPRTPLIPGITDTECQIQKLIAFYQDHHIKKASLLGNNPIWIDKCDQLGINSDREFDSQVKNFYGRKQLKNVKELFRKNGIEIVSS